MKRLAVAVAVAYVANALLIAAAEKVLILAASADQYLGADVLTQCAIQIFCGYVCGRICNRSLAPAALIALGLLVGSVSLVATWHTEPHWYALALLAIYSPSVWLGYRLSLRRYRGKSPARLS